MSSTRSKLMLDERSFQGLLAAAFTIQQHNERQKTARLNPTLNGKEEHLKATAEVCRQCGVPLPQGRTQCPSCDAENFRPGERLQRTWASMWLMSQEKSLAPEDHEKPVPDAPPLRSVAGINGHDRDAQAPSPISPLAKPRPALADLIPEAMQEAANTLIVFSAASRQEEPTVNDRASDDPAVAMPVGEALALDNRPDDLHIDIPLTSDLPVDDPPALADSASTSAMRRGFLDLRVKLRFHRADLYLGIAILVAFLALLFPATATQRPTLRPWERMLIAIGIAEAPPPATVHHTGDPNIRVWVDTHAALYYCPGAELYGKSPNGHYSTQREAQLDRFEPAERVVCVE